MADSKGVVKNIEVLACDDVIEDVSGEEDCGSDSDSMSNIDARKMFSNRSIKDLSHGNFQRFKLMNQDS